MSEGVGASVLLAVIGGLIAAFPVSSPRGRVALLLTGAVFALPLLARLWLTAVAG